MPLRRILTAGAGGDTGATDDQYTATLIVAASNSLNTGAAHYQCDGVADEVQINLALGTLPTVGGGRVILLEGDYILANPITFSNSDSTIQGQGESTLINGDGLGTGDHAILVTGRTNVHLLGFSIRTEDAGGKNCHCIYVSDGSNNLLIQRVHVVASDDDGIHFAGTSMQDIRIIDCDIEGTDSWGIIADMSPQNTLNRVHIEGCTFQDLAESAIETEASGSYSEWHIIGNTIYLVGNDGIDLDVFTEGIIQGNAIGNIGGDGIHLGANSPYNIITDNKIGGTLGKSATGDGIHVAGAVHNLIANNECTFCGEHGIHVSGIATVIDGNYCYDNSQNLAGSHDGIRLATGADRCIVTNNYCGTRSAEDQSQNDGIHLATAVDDCVIEDNYCYQGLASGIVLAGFADDNLITGNYCNLNSVYGIDIATANAQRNVVKDNRLLDNVGAPIRDNGTDTRTEEAWCGIVNTGQVAIAETFQVAGYRPVTVLTNGNDEYAYVTLQVPLEMQQMLDANWIIIPGASGNLVWQCHTSFGKVCANEQQDQHTDSNVLTTSAVTLDELECLEAAAAMASLAGGDNAGIRFFRNSTNQDDTVAADCYAVGLRLRYV